YGGAINAKVIASAPKNSAHRFMRKKKYAHIQFKHKDLRGTFSRSLYAHIQFKHKDLENVPRSETPPLILFDPFREEETDFIEKWVTPAYPDAYLMRFPYAGHTVLNTMQQSGKLKQFIKEYIEENRILDIELLQDNSYIWNAEKGRRLSKLGYATEAKSYYRRSLELQQNGEAAA